MTNIIYCTHAIAYTAPTRSHSSLYHCQISRRDPRAVYLPIGTRALDFRSGKIMKNPRLLMPKAQLFSRSNGPHHSS
ncbi:MAG: hypothetical protein F6K26_14495 [Moorea sp. SIO2I5]|nr:hypothetical protein [Moorena sp. SIO2I5]